MAIALQGGYAIAQSSNGSSVTTASLDTTGSSLLIVLLSDFGNNSVNDNQSNTWTALTRYGSPGSTGCLRFYYCNNPTTSASHTFSSASVGGSYPALCALGFTGTAASSFDQQNGNTTGGSAETITVGSITPTENNELIVIGGGWDMRATSSSDIGTLIDRRNVSDGLAFAIGLWYEIQTTATARNPVIATQAGGGLTGNIASFKEAAAGGAVLTAAPVISGQAVNRASTY